MQKRNIINGLLGAIGFLIVAFIAFSLRFGLSWWTSSENEMLMFFPIWAVVALYVGYSASSHYYKKKAMYFKEEYEPETAANNWKLYKTFMLSKFLNIIAKLFAIMTPFYILAYIDESEMLNSSPLLIITFAVISVVCFISGRIIQNKYIVAKD
ncbi:hypothetical protein M2451_003997 [Dysgonomonas sp. PFB1-18]|uniref:hypothetical protein n=1 Tax=unclassified Dysgonomonas TaxID=2630389 RepID=UPI00247548F9|nr:MULTISPECIES: hypothetical protein [unclassified Dysgonomonas]MDH6311134.1 hypothetical protein [Dysgonomonas sp. PF1-14]MDH6341012.1 hypothetical protein [Dysgonomonas sp. PF1-16]MDH6382652.1 hypothetical protein [Dysgonomonas sp. PFB1-18]MDH6399999.1 hypothetical protein [Dysgonomonas sp. PF1-23]